MPDASMIMARETLTEVNVDESIQAGTKREVQKDTEWENVESGVIPNFASLEMGREITVYLNPKFLPLVEKPKATEAEIIKGIHELS